jgi:DNA-binding GntR family transcriptional regulator
MPLPATTAPLPRVCLNDAAYHRIRDWILDGTLTPGEALRDEALAEALGMSRTPIRDALHRLEEEGLVVTTATRRTYVSEVTIKQAREIYPIIGALEALAVRLALPHIDASALDVMRAANQELSAALEASDPAAATAADEAIHHAFVACCGNDELIALLSDLHCKVRRIERAFWGSADRTPSLDDHEAIIAALHARNARQAERMVARNMARGLAWLNPTSAPQNGTQA